MAKPACSMCGEFEAMVIMTNLDTGESESPCAQCFPDFILNIAQGITGLSFDDASQPSDSPLHVNGSERFPGETDDNDDENDVTPIDPKPSGRSRRGTSGRTTDDAENTTATDDDVAVVAENS